MLRQDKSGYLKSLRYNRCEALQYWSADCHWTILFRYLVPHWTIGLLQFAGLDTLERPALLTGPDIPRRPDHFGTWITKRPVFLFSCLFQTAAWRHSPERWQLRNYSVQIGLPNSGRPTFHFDAVSYASVG